MTHILKRTLVIVTLISLCFFNLTSCNHSDDVSEVQTGSYFNSLINIKVLNKQGENLLDSTTTGYFPDDSISFYYLINGEIISAQEAFNNSGNTAQLDVIGGEISHQSQGQSFIRFFTYTGDESAPLRGEEPLKGYGYSFVKYGYNDLDTIKTEWLKTTALFTITAVWYNDVEFAKYEIYNVIK